MRRNLFILGFGVLSGVWGTGCLHQPATDYQSLVNDLNTKGTPERVPLQMSSTSSVPSAPTPAPAPARTPAKIIRTSSTELPAPPTPSRVVGRTKVQPGTITQIATQLPHLESQAPVQHATHTTVSPAPIQVVPDNSEKVKEKISSGAVLWDSPPLEGKSPVLVPQAFDKVSGVQSHVDGVIPGQVFHKAQPELAIPNFAVPVTQQVVSAKDSVDFGPSNKFQTIVGQVYQYKHNWRLRYAGVESADPYGGCVVLTGEGLESLKDGQIVRVSGSILPPSDRTSPHRYLTTDVRVMIER